MDFEWYEHQSLLGTENDGVKLTWYMTAYTDKKLKHSRSDKTLLLKEEQE